MSVNLKYDTDPEALAWAREKVTEFVDKMREFERQASDKGTTDPAQWRKIANLVESHFIGGRGCVIASFDERLPAFAPILAEALTPEVVAKQEASRIGIRDRNARLLPDQQNRSE